MGQRKSQRDIDKAIRHLMDYLPDRSPWERYFGEYMGDMLALIADREGLAIEDAETMLMGGDYGSMAFGFLFEDFATTHWVDTDRQGSMIDEYVMQRGWRESALGRRYLQALKRSELNYWEVTDVRPGAWIAVRPQNTDQSSIRVHERAASESVTQWDGLVARVLKLEGKHAFAGGVLSLPPQSKPRVDALLSELAGHSRKELQSLIDSGECDALSVNIDAIVEEEMQDQLPRVLFTVWAGTVLRATEVLDHDLRTFDDERVSPSTLHWPVQAAPQSIRSQLDAIPALSRVETDRWVWRSTESAEPGDASGHVLGFVQLGDTLSLNTLASERAARGRELIAKALGSMIGQPLAGLGRQAWSEGHNDGQASALDPNDDPEIAAVLAQRLRQHYRETLDMPVPMLGDKTPRECAADPALQSRVIHWLKTLENAHSRPPGQPFDTRWMWDALGLTREPV